MHFRTARHMLCVGLAVACTGPRVAQAGECGCMDVVLVVDSTGSMASAIGNVVDGLGEILDAAVEASGDTAGNDNLRMGVVTFADFIEVNQPLIDDLAAVTAEISAIIAGGGSSYPEPSDAAVEYVVTGATGCVVIEDEGPLGAFRDGCLKILVLITDAPPAGCDDSYADGVDDVSALDAADAAALAGVLISAVLVDDGPVSTPAHPGGVEPHVMAAYANATGGSFVTVPANGSGTGDAIVSIVEDCGGGPPPPPPPPPVDPTGRVVWRHLGTGSNVMWIVRPDGVSALLALPVLLDSRWRIVATGDFNDDGFDDLVWRNLGTGRNVIWTLEEGGFQDSTTLPRVSNVTWKIVGAADIDGNGTPDLLWRHQPTGTNKVWLMDGTAVASRKMLIKVSAAYLLAATGDFDGDGRGDILWRHKTAGRNLLWLMNGTTVATSAKLPDLNASWRAAGAGDFDGDGHADILWRRQNTGQNAIWRMDGPTAVATGALSSHPWPSWSVVGITDFDADGKDDILWRNNSIGDNLVWFADGFSVAGTLWLSNIPVGDWNASVGRIE